jgi:sialidase-1
VRDGEALSIYIDGTHAATATATGIGETTANTESITIGQRGDDDIFFDGSIDEVAVFSRALTGLEVSQLYASY